MHPLGANRAYDYLGHVALGEQTRSTKDGAHSSSHPRAGARGTPFRDALGRFATGVAFVTAAPDGEPAGLIVNSLTSVSLEPPLVSFCPSRSSLTWSRMRRAGRFGVNILGRQHERFAKRATPAGADRFAGLNWELGHGGVPLLTDALATLECEIFAEHPAGDHWIVVGRVDDVAPRPSKTRSSSSPAPFAPSNSELTPPDRSPEHHSLPSEGALRWDASTAESDSGPAVRTDSPCFGFPPIRGVSRQQKSSLAALPVRTPAATPTGTPGLPVRSGDGTL